MGKLRNLPPPPGGWGHGGWRPGAGRPKDPNAGVPHTPRARVASRFPVHVTVGLVDGLPTLRAKATYALIREMLAASEKPRFRIVHYAIQSKQLQLIVEASDADRLSRGMQGLLVRFARNINSLWGRSGTVFRDRYDSKVLKTPREVRDALVKVLGAAWRDGVSVKGDVDLYSSGPWFDGWKERIKVPNLPECPVSKAKTWLLKEGWREKGGRLSVREVKAAARKSASARSSTRSKP